MSEPALLGDFAGSFEVDPKQFWPKPREINPALLVGLESVGVRKGGGTLLAT